MFRKSKVRYCVESWCCIACHFTTLLRLCMLAPALCVPRCVRRRNLFSCKQMRLQHAEHRPLRCRTRVLGCAAPRTCSRAATWRRAGGRRRRRGGGLERAQGLGGVHGCGEPRHHHPPTQHRSSSTELPCLSLSLSACLVCRWHRSVSMRSPPLRRTAAARVRTPLRPSVAMTALSS
jgi:hypothetical protein